MNASGIQHSPVLKHSMFTMLYLTIQQYLGVIIILIIHIGSPYLPEEEHDPRVYVSESHEHEELIFETRLSHS